ncbi:hypothetical protein ABIB25_005755 [Nakamurella sp. UYEF19]
MRIRLGLAYAAVVAAGLSVLGGTAAASTPHSSSSVVGHAYVNDNAVGTNTIAVFDRHADGSLSPTPGSPVPTGGAGLGAGLGSQGAIQVSPNGRFLLAVDAGSNQISVLRLTANGTPVAVGEPVSSRGVKPVSIAINRFGLVYVANVGDGGSNYAGFFLTPAGRLIPLPYTTVPVPEGSGVGDVLFNSTGDRLVGTRDNPSLIDSFTVRPDGRLVPAQGSPLPGPEPGADRSRVPSDRSVSALREQRPRGRWSGNGLGFPGEPSRPAELHRRLTGPGLPDRSLLGRDQPRRQVPLRREHRVRQPVPLCDRP